jgi:deaminated glutathione amidase
MSLRAQRPDLDSFLALAPKHGVWLSLGGFPQPCGDKFANAHLVVDASGAVVARYDKAHLFDVDLSPAGPVLLESSYTARGRSIGPPIDTPVGRVGPPPPISLTPQLG